MDARFIVIETPRQIAASMRYTKIFCLLFERALHRERDIREPESLETFTCNGEVETWVTLRDRTSRHLLDHHLLGGDAWVGIL
jgi:hypothetical protein